MPCTSAEAQLPTPTMATRTLPSFRWRPLCKPVAPAAWPFSFMGAPCGGSGVALGELLADGQDALGDREHGERREERDAVGEGAPLGGDEDRSEQDDALGPAEQ